MPDTPSLCKIPGCDQPVAAYSGVGRRPVYCTGHTSEDLRLAKRRAAAANRRATEALEAAAATNIDASVRTTARAAVAASSELLDAMTNALDLMAASVAALNAFADPAAVEARLAAARAEVAAAVADLSAEQQRRQAAEARADEAERDAAAARAERDTALEHAAGTSPDVGAPASVRRRLHDAAAAHPDVAFRDDYRGRDMPTGTCLALSGDPGSLTRLLIAAFPSEDAVDVYLRAKLRVDAYSQHDVWYWPALRTDAADAADRRQYPPRHEHRHGTTGHGTPAEGCPTVSDYTVNVTVHDANKGKDVNLRTLPREEVEAWLLAAAQAGDRDGMKACHVVLARNDTYFPVRNTLQEAKNDMLRALREEILLDDTMIASDEFDVDEIARDTLIEFHDPMADKNLPLPLYKVVSRRCLEDAAARWTR